MNIGSFFIAHTIAFHLGYILDLMFGDPHRLPHPVRLIGLLISGLTKLFLRNHTEEKEYNKKEFVFGILTVLTVVILTCVFFGGILFLAYKIHTGLGILVEAVMTYQILATKSLRDESMKVFDALKNGTLDDGRKAVSMIVGRDTECLNREGVIKAAVETVAENTSDGVIAPMLYTAIGGPVLGFLYKSINTMDSMIGYKNDKFLYFGRAAAKTDDVVNYIPARISAVLMIIAAIFGGSEYSFSNAVKIFKRDRYKHASPNSAQTEAVCAGALGIRLAGDAFYFGKIKEKPFIGDDIRKPELMDIDRACTLMFVSAGICESLLVIAMAGIGLL